MYILGVLQMLVNKDLSCVYEDLSQSPLNGAKYLYAFCTESLSSIQFVESLCLTWPSGRLSSLCSSFFPVMIPSIFSTMQGKVITELPGKRPSFLLMRLGNLQDSYLASISHVSQYNSNALFYQTILPPMAWVRRN